MLEQSPVKLAKEQHYLTSATLGTHVLPRTFGYRHRGEVLKLNCIYIVSFSLEITNYLFKVFHIICSYIFENIISSVTSQIHSCNIYLGISGMNSNEVIEICFRCIELEANTEALSDFSCIGTQHMESNNFLLGKEQSN